MKESRCALAAGHGHITTAPLASSAGGIWSTADSGTTWNLDLNTGAEMSSIDHEPVSPDSTDVWCVGYLPNFNGVVYKTRIPRLDATGVGATAAFGPAGGKAFPNPFFGRTRIDLDSSAASAAVFDLSGRRIRVLESREGIFEWDGRDGAGRELPAGVYLVRAQAPGGKALRVVRIR